MNTQYWIAFFIATAGFVGLLIWAFTSYPIKDGRPKSRKTYWQPPQSNEWQPPTGDPYWEAYVASLPKRKKASDEE